MLYIVQLPNEEGDMHIILSVKKKGYRDGVKKEKRQDRDGLYTGCSTIGDRITWSP